MQTLPRLPLAVRTAQALSRVVTWGLRSDERHELLLESDADWQLMHSDQGAVRVLLRAVRGVPAGIWTRMEDREHTAVPAAIAFTLLAVAAISAGLLERTYPVDIRRFVFVTAIGLGLAGATMALSPRSIPLRLLRIPTLILFVGFLGMATHMPAESDWKYEGPMVGTPEGDALTAAGFTIIALGCLVVAAAGIGQSPLRLFRTGGVAIVAGAVLFGAGQIVWGVAAVTVDPTVTATSVSIGLVAFSIAHVTPRLRHLVTD